MRGPRLVDVRSILAGDPDVEPILEHLRGGGLVMYPTDTVYGLGGVPSGEVVTKLGALKARPSDKPMLMLIPGRETAGDLVWTDEASRLADIFWPGSVTLILADPQARFPLGIRSDSGAVAVRVSPHPVVKSLVDGLGGPLISTSANLPGEPPALDGHGAMEVARTLGLGEELWVLDAGSLPPSPPSTIIDCSGGSPVVVREGTVPVGRVRCVLPEIEAASDE